MTEVTLTINGRKSALAVEPRTHLADVLREKLNLTATHLRCEQGACGACTILIDGRPARACITYAVMCDGASVDTIEGLQDDSVMTALRRAFSKEHGLQCGYCTPGMLVTARDIVQRLPDADEKRIRLELSGNLCRCTGYVGIVRAIKRVLDERRAGVFSISETKQSPFGPVGARPATTESQTPAVTPATPQVEATGAVEGRTLGLAGNKPNFEISQSFVISRPLREVWTFFGDFAGVAGCLPGAALTSTPQNENVEGKMSVKIGPITANFRGRAHVTRDDTLHRGQIAGTGIDQVGGSRVNGEVVYALESKSADKTEMTLTIRALLAGALAQFGRSGIVEELLARILETFAHNIENHLAGGPKRPEQSTLNASTLIWSVLKARLKKVLAKFGLR
ncbi:MAG TPA: 2Fe-2S iron-sulfur cluster-binding protein [Pseudolabrys sp.]|nr:2Fe-2S iron-sulfur cluster-binding protein [Pseudolabrys sp.]